MPTERTSLLTAEGIRLGRTAASRADAIDQCGRVLLELGAVEADYLAAMHEREESLSTYIGENVAIPHGTDQSRQYVKRTTLVVLQFPDGVEWGPGNTVNLCVGIAANGSEQVGILSALAQVLMDGEKAAQLRQATDAGTVLNLLQSIDEERDQP
ncbi:PTS system mannitol-specific IIA component/phosphocarrier protein FPr [Kibdelosporangium sp. 4NS15]|uniref:Mannitol-specific phosphotransferase enzyme IIA component n=1 Tax=Kibdelosporangium persicum TaxID=2698649 RepID=A0ABX2EV08_9PSEU|nr:PTS sugar transporter subunit IIA [Kibdelosporangium persicum]NRN62809.1 PTS system mannitol-specific IIA component/phosphocarrier protein FPr [Kibdelosporangium persicum]